MRILTVFLLLMLMGCATVNLETQNPITEGTIELGEFKGPTGDVVSNAIRAELSQKRLLANKEQGNYILTGSTHFPGWTDGIAFSLKNKKGDLILFGDATSGGFLNPSELGKAVGKKIAKKITQKN